MAEKSEVPSGWKTMAARPVGCRPCSCIGTTAVDIANRRSSVGWRRERLPRRTSRNPMAGAYDLRRGLRVRDAAEGGRVSAVVGVDIGTTSAKAAAFEPDG